MKHQYARFQARTLLLGLAFLGLIGLPACANLPGWQGLPWLATPTSAPDATGTASAGPAVTTLAQSTPETTAPQSTGTPGGPSILRIWLPPQFDPASGGPAGGLLQKRLDEFTDRRPDIRLEVRIKAVDGPGGMLDSLTTASAAAPLALPDLIALPRPLLESAALKGFLHPYDPQAGSFDDPDWYEYARQLGRVQDSTFGLPFAGDALVLAYQAGQIEPAPANFAAVLDLGSTFVFPAADPQALVSIALYQASGGTILDSEGRPTLDADRLASILNFYDQAGQSGVIPLWVTQVQNDEQAWEALADGQAAMATAWFSRMVTLPPASQPAALLPTPDGEPFTLASGWVWALASTNADHLRLSAELAAFLSESSFTGPWTALAGYLPARRSALALWPAVARISLAGEVAEAARLAPNTDILSSLGPLLEQAVTEVLKQQQEPLQAAERAVEALGVR